MSAQVIDSVECDAETRTNYDVPVRGDFLLR